MLVGSHKRRLNNKHKISSSCKSPTITPAKNRFNALLLKLKRALIYSIYHTHIEDVFGAFMCFCGLEVQDK